LVRRSRRVGFVRYRVHPRGVRLVIAATVFDVVFVFTLAGLAARVRYVVAIRAQASCRYFRVTGNAAFRSRRLAFYFTARLAV